MFQYQSILQLKNNFERKNKKRMRKDQPETKYMHIFGVDTINHIFIESIEFYLFDWSHVWRSRILFPRSHSSVTSIKLKLFFSFCFFFPSNNLRRQIAVQIWTSWIFITNRMHLFFFISSFPSLLVRIRKNIFAICILYHIRVRLLFFCCCFGVHDWKLVCSEYIFVWFFMIIMYNIMFVAVSKSRLFF